MKKAIVVFAFIGGVLIGGYFIKPMVNDVSAVDYGNEEYYMDDHCGFDNSFLDRFLNDDLTEEQVNLITVKFEELLLEYEIIEDDLYQDMDITHDIMIEMLEYLETLDIEHYEDYHRGHMNR